MAAVFTISGDTATESRISTAREEPTDFLHSFGGPPKHDGIVYTGCEKPPHLLYTLDLTDPNIRIDIPSVRWLPMFYAFKYDASPLFYRVVSDERVEIVRQERTKWTDDFPYADYPIHFPFHWATATTPDVIDDHIEDEDYKEQWEELIEEHNDEGMDTNANDLIAMVSGLWQGAPKTRCINPDCGDQNMNILAVVSHDEIDGLSFWGSSGDEEGVQIVYEICPKCEMIYVTNQCT